MSLGYEKYTTWWYFKRLSNVIKENSPLMIIVDQISWYWEPSCVSADYTWKWHSVNERSFGKIAWDVVTSFLEEDI